MKFKSFDLWVKLVFKSIIIRISIFILQYLKSQLSHKSFLSINLVLNFYWWDWLKCYLWQAINSLLSTWWLITNHNLMILWHIYRRILNFTEHKRMIHNFIHWHHLRRKCFIHVLRPLSLLHIGGFTSDGWFRVAFMSIFWAFVDQWLPLLILR